MLQKSNAMLNDKHDALASTNSALVIQNKQLSIDVDVLSRPRSADLALENESLQTSLKDSKRDCNVLERENKHIHSKVSHLECSVSKTKSELVLVQSEFALAVDAQEEAEKQAALETGRSAIARQQLKVNKRDRKRDEEKYQVVCTPFLLTSG